MRDISKNPLSMYARVPQAMAQFVLKIEKLSQIMGPTPILEMARLRSPSPIMAPDGNRHKDADCENLMEYANTLIAMTIHT